MKKYQLPLKNNFFSQQNPNSVLTKISASITPTSKLQSAQGKRTPSASANNRNGKATKTESSPSQMPLSGGQFNQDSGNKEHTPALTSRNEPLIFKQLSGNTADNGKRKPNNNQGVRMPLQPSQLQQVFGSMTNSSAVSLAATAYFPKSSAVVGQAKPQGAVRSPEQPPKMSSVDNHVPPGNNNNNKQTGKAPERFLFSINGVPGYMTVSTARGLKAENQSTFPSTDEGLKQQKPGSITNSKYKECNPETIEDSVVVENRENQFICQVHPEKKAKYLAAENGSSLGKIPYCSKCAIDLALKGVRVFQIFDEEKPHRSPKGQLQVNDSSFQDSVQDSLFHTPKGVTPNLVPASLDSLSNLGSVNVNSVSQNANQAVQAGGKNTPGGTLLSSYSSQVLKTTLTPSVDEEATNEDEGEELVRKVELEKFLTKLDRVKVSNTASLARIGCQKKEMVARHKRQLKRIQDVCKVALRLVEEGFKNLVAEVEDSHKSLIDSYFRFEEQIAANLGEMDNIKNDIAMNLERILKHMNLKPFKIICSKYEEKLDGFEQINKSFVESGVELKLSLLALNSKSLQSYELEFLNFLEPFLKTSARRFKILETDSAFLDERTEPDERSSASKRTNAVYVSFENKEIFQNEIKASKNPEQKEERLKVLQNRDQNIRLGGVGPAGSAGDMLSPSNKKEVSLSLEMQSPGSLFNKGKNTLAHSSLAGRLSAFDSKEPSPPKVNSSNKYLNLLEKVNTTQSNTNMLCTSIIKSNSNFSPEAFMDELSPKRLVSDGKENYPRGAALKSTSDGLGVEYGDMRSVAKPGSLLAGGNNIASRLLAEDLKLKHANKGEIKNYENFFHFIENKVNDESKSQLSSSYQKTLFCSPHFKDHHEKENEIET